MKFTFRDLGFAFLSAFLGSVMGYLINQINSVGAITAFGIRCTGTACFILPVIIFNSNDIWYDKSVNLNLFLRSIAGCIAICGYYFGFANLSIAEASMLFYSTPIFTIIIGHLFLKEYCGFTGIICTIFSICGVCTVCVPQFSFNYSTSTLIGVTGSLIGALGEAICLAFTRKTTEISPFIVGFWWSTIGILFSACLSGAFNEFEAWQCGWEAIYLFAISVIGFISEVSLVTALKSTNAIIVSLVLTSEIIWAFMIQCFINKETPSSMAIIGGILIGISLILPPVMKISSRNAE